MAAISYTMCRQTFSVFAIKLPIINSITLGQEQNTCFC